MVREPCPFGTIISIETALLFTQGCQKSQGLFGRIITLQSFCVACRQKRRLRTLLSSRDLLSDRADDEKTCEHQSCVKSRFHTLKYCTSHRLFRPTLTALPPHAWTQESFELAWTMSSGHVAQYFKKSYADINASLWEKCRKVC